MTVVDSQIRVELLKQAKEETDLKEEGYAPSL